MENISKDILSEIIRYLNLKDLIDATLKSLSYLK